MTRARDIADLGQDKTTLASYVDTGVTSTDLERIDITTEGTSENSKVVTADSSGHVTLAGELRGPATLVVDPAAVGDNTGLLQVKGNLQVDGTTTTINSTTLTVDDKNIVLGSGAADSAAADGSGITIDGASATMLYTHSTTSFDFNKPVNVTGALTATSASFGDGNITNVGDIAVDTISSDAGTSIGVTLGTDAGDDFNVGGGKLVVEGDTGKVGIGSSAPTYKFDVVHDSHNGTIAQFGGDGGDGSITDVRIRNTHQASGSTNEATRLIFELGNTNAGWIEGFKEADGSSAGNRTGGLAFYTTNANSSTEKMRINSSGKVGIGNTAPEVDLHIGSYQSGSGQTATLRLSEGNGGGDSTGFDVKYVGSSDKLFFTSKDGSGNFADRMVITRDDGNVGINTATPGFGGEATHKYLTILNTNTTDTVDRPAVLELGCSNKGGGVHVGKIDFWSDVDGGNDNVGTFLCAQDGTTTNNVGGKFSFRTKADGGSITEKMIIDQAGNVGIGSSAPSSQLSIGETSGTPTFTIGRTGTNPIITAGGTNTDLKIACVGSGGALTFDTNSSTRMTITSGGQVRILCANMGANPSSSNSGVMIGNTSTGSNFFGGGTGIETHLIFGNTNGTCGSIQTNGSGTSYNESSDYRLKENVTSLTGAIDRINQLKPSRFNFIADPNTTMDGFLAHEVSDYVPEAVSGEKDQVDENGEIKPQGIDKSKLVPLIVASIQELSAKVTALESA